MAILYEGESLITTGWPAVSVLKLLKSYLNLLVSRDLDLTIVTNYWTMPPLRKPTVIYALAEKGLLSPPKN